MLYLIDFMQNPSENISTSQATTGLLIQDPICPVCFVSELPGTIAAGVSPQQEKAR